jgi:HEPN domain-containing protein
MDEAQLDSTRRWVRKATNDLESAKLLAARGPLDTAIYHCQQAAEKSVKAYLVSRDLAFEKTHDIVRIVRVAEEVEPSFASLIGPARMLTPLAWQFRYPSEAPGDEPTREQLDEALQHAQAIYDFVLRVLPRDTHP